MRQCVPLPVTSGIVLSVPEPRYDRRLADKVLAAFAHAYEVRAFAAAALLRRVLEEAERAGPGGAGERRRANVLRQADRWVAFVDAREAYRCASARTPGDPEEVEQARCDMFEAYRRWSEV